MQKIDYTTELAQLMKFTGLTATAIRMYSVYSPYGYSSGDFGGLHADPARSPIDLMFLADALHHFERIGNDIEIGDPKRIIDTCCNLLSIFTNYEIEDPKHSRQAKPTFELWRDLVDLNTVKVALANIRAKASA